MMGWDAAEMPPKKPVAHALPSLPALKRKTGTDD
jgi:hypothetical protein